MAQSRCVKNRCLKEDLIKTTGLMDPSVIVDNFHNLMIKLVKQLGVVYPENASLLSAAVYLTAITDAEAKLDVMQQYFDAIKEDMDGLRDHDMETVTRIIDGSSLMKRLGLHEIIRDPDFGPSAEVFFAYLDQLTSFCRMQFEISGRMLKAIQEVGRELGQRVQNGQVPTSQHDIEELGRQVVGKLGEQPDSKYIMKETQKLLDILTESEQFEKLLMQAVSGKK